MTPGKVAPGEAATEGRSDEKWCQNRARIKLHGSGNQEERNPSAMETPASRSAGNGGRETRRSPVGGGGSGTEKRGKKGGAEAALHRPHGWGCGAKEAAPDGSRGRPWKGAECEAPVGQGNGSAGGGALANAMAGCSAGLQRQSRGRSEGDEAPRIRHAKATERGLGCAEIQRPRQAMDAGAPRGPVWRTQRRASARECSGIPEAAVRGMEARRRSAT